ncbi:hypothetical protein D5086_025932 [Populus alba]|uniref:Uncharacterized protein n=1 Tax=Populus alba TaxID=43335 RepID=A0ACC4B297_POPAL
MPPKTTTLFTKSLSLLPPTRLRSLTTAPDSTHLTDPHSTHSFCSRALNFSAKKGFLREGKQVHAHVIKLGFYCRGSDYESSVYMGFCYFRKMLLDKVGFDAITLNGLFRACLELNDVEIGRELHCFIVKLGFAVNSFVNSALVDLYGKCGLVKEARRAFDEVYCRDLVLWNVMLSCYAMNCLAEEASGFFKLMQEENFMTDGFTFSSDARKAFDGMSARNVVSWNTMVVGYGRLGDGGEAMKLLIGMFQEDLRPDEITLASIIRSCSSALTYCEIMQVNAYVLKNGFHAFLSIANALINAYSKGGSIAMALQCFSTVLEPDLVTWTSLISAAGLLDEAFNVLNSMSIEYSSDTLGAFIGACKIHGEVKLAKWAAEKLFEMEPNKPVNYTLMSSVFASEGNWHDVARIHKLMRDRCGHGVPGCSWMEYAGPLFHLMPWLETSFSTGGSVGPAEVINHSASVSEVFCKNS